SRSPGSSSTPSGRRAPTRSPARSPCSPRPSSPWGSPGAGGSRRLRKCELGLPAWRAALEWPRRRDQPLGRRSVRVSVIESTVDGRYQVITRIASGGMGEVYRAHDAVLGREVALKVLHPHLAGDRGFVDRFRREARAAAIL